MSWGSVCPSAQKRSGERQATDLQITNYKLQIVFVHTHSYETAIQYHAVEKRFENEIGSNQQT